MITPKQRAFLRGLGNALEPLAQVGKEGLSENSVEGINLLLEARELVKIKVLKNNDDGSRVVAEELAKLTHSDIVQVIGNIVILYKKSTRKNFKHIQLP
ncbi:MAG: ribosome assembly RNA-binding protein YhbY [Clostridia bacterium]|nr:ribosome assembly RNA-binding protein YhbY [Clostridia bacterium]